MSINQTYSIVECTFVNVQINVHVYIHVLWAQNTGTVHVHIVKVRTVKCMSVM